MSSTLPEQNEFGQPIGPEVGDWSPVALPSKAPMEGRFCSLAPVDPAEDCGPLFAALTDGDDGRLWTYLSFERPHDRDDLGRLLVYFAREYQPFAIRDGRSGALLGVASYMRPNPGAGSIEVGAVIYSPRLQRSPIATEAMYLMMARVFATGYRRYEWKCHALNAASRAAALRLGFQFEGIFRQHAIYKRRSRDTAWFSVIDSDWAGLSLAFEAWLAPENFDREGRQIRSLASLRLGTP